MNDNDEYELDRMKAEIPIADLAIGYGYQLVKRDSCKTSLAFRCEARASKIIVATDIHDGHSIFFDIHHRASGSVLDFVMFVENCNLGRARKILREQLTGGSHPLKPTFRRPEAIEVDQAHLYAAWQTFRPYQGGYLESRGLAPETISLFSSQIRLDRRGNAVFRHSDIRGTLTGWEAKNRSWTGFSPGGRKSLFQCLVGQQTPDCPYAIIVAESAIDAMSYWQLEERPGLYLSFGGGLSEAQKTQLGELFDRWDMSVVLLATDNDEVGEQYASELESLVPLFYSRRRPPGGCKDWNDVLVKRPVARKMEKCLGGVVKVDEILGKGASDETRIDG